MSIYNFFLNLIPGGNPESLSLYPDFGWGDTKFCSIGKTITKLVNLTRWLFFWSQVAIQFMRAFLPYSLDKIQLLRIMLSFLFHFQFHLT
jgi:hypothetical protein